MPISTLFSGKWLRTEIGGDEYEFLIMLGRPKLHATLSPQSKEVQLVCQFLRDGVHEILAHVNMCVLGIKEIDFNIHLELHGKKQKQEADEKKFGDCHSVSKFISDTAYRTIYHMPPNPDKKGDFKKTMIVTRQLEGKDTTRVLIELHGDGRVVKCFKVYERDNTMDDHDHKVIAVMHSSVRKDPKLSLYF